MSILAGLSTCGCSKRAVDRLAPQSPGSITAIALHIGDRQGEMLSIGVWGPGIDWTMETGAETCSAYAQVAIDSTDFSLTHTMTERDREGSDTGVTKSFEPGDYSVVFFLGGVAAPSDQFAEIRLHLNGDMVVQAPDSGGWTTAAPR